MDLFKTFCYPAEPGFLLNYFDICFLIILNISFYFIYIKNNVGMDALQKITWFFLFGIVIPLVSVKIEINSIYRAYAVVDPFNLWYTFFRFPTWWTIGVLNYILLRAILKKLK